ncbi:MAG: MFS transporter, partial [Terracidiphilus sp.]
MPGYPVTSGGSAAGVEAPEKRGYNFFLLLVAGLGGLLYGIDIGIIGGALPYLEATSGLTPSQLSVIVAAVLLGSVLSTLFAGLLADWMGRKALMAVSGALFALSIPVICFSHSYAALFSGRLLQGVSAGFIGIVVPLYLAECLVASKRGKGTGVFQWLLTLGIVAAALVGMYYSYRVAAVTASADAATVLAFKDQVWRRIFWISLPPGVFFLVGSLLVAESPRWLFKRGKKEQARAALMRSRAPEQVELEMREMEEAAQSALHVRGGVRESLLKRKYVIPFLLACVILACNTATGVNSIIGYNVGILLQSGLSDVAAHWGYVIFTMVNFVMTFVGMQLIDRKGRKFLFILGTSGIMVALVTVGTLFLKTERLSVDSRDQVQAMVSPEQDLTMHFDRAEAARLLAAHPDAGGKVSSDHASLAIIYSYGDFTAETNYVRSDDAAGAPIHVNRTGALPANKVEAFFANPFGNFEAARVAPLKIERAVVGSVPDER